MSTTARLAVLALAAFAFGGCATLGSDRAARTWMPASHSPEPFAPALLTPDSHSAGVTFAADGRTLYFYRAVDGRSTIFESRLVGGDWTQPVVAPFSGKFEDAMPSFSPDGRRMFFISTRPSQHRAGKARSDYDIWVVERTGGAWNTPRPLDPPINTDQYEVGDSVARSGNLYFAAFRPGAIGRLDIWVSRFANGGYLPPENLGRGVNSPVQESHPVIDPDERFIVFERHEAVTTAGRFALYVSYRNNGGWTEARELGPEVNQRRVTSHPKLSPDGKVLFWSSSDEVTDAPSVVMHACVSDVLARLR